MLFAPFSPRFASLNVFSVNTDTIVEIRFRVNIFVDLFFTVFTVTKRLILLTFLRSLPSAHCFHRARVEQISVPERKFSSQNCMAIVKPSHA